MQCCGEPFALEQTVSWGLDPIQDRDYLSTVLGEEMASRITDYEDHHDVSDVGAARLQGRVRSIEAVSCEFAVQGAYLNPIPGSRVIEPRSAASGQENENDNYRFLGYIVDLETAD